MTVSYISREKYLGKGMVMTQVSEVSLTPLVKTPAHENVFPSPQHWTSMPEISFLSLTASGYAACAL